MVVARVAYWMPVTACGAAQRLPSRMPFEPPTHWMWVMALAVAVAADTTTVSVVVPVCRTHPLRGHASGQIDPPPASLTRTAMIHPYLQMTPLGQVPALAGMALVVVVAVAVARSSQVRAGRSGRGGGQCREGKIWLGIQMLVAAGGGEVRLEPLPHIMMLPVRMQQHTCQYHDGVAVARLPAVGPPTMTPSKSMTAGMMILAVAVAVGMVAVGMAGCVAQLQPEHTQLPVPVPAV